MRKRTNRCQHRGWKTLTVVYTVGHRFIPFVALSMLTACSMTVAAKRVPGTYLLSYPFGTETLLLKADGTFVQEVAIRNEQPVTVRGSWTFDPKESRVELFGSMIVVDGFEHLRNDWRTVTPGLVSMDVEMHWFRIVM